jgi:allantoicase
VNDFIKLPDLSAERLGGKVLFANDEFFAPRENLLKATKPVYIEGKYTEFGKWMDGWETRRRRTPGYDWCVIQLGVPGILRGTIVETTHFKGNHPEHCSLEACAVDGALANAATAEAQAWTEILPKSPLKGDSINPFDVSDAHRYTHVRFKIYPDGGVARLRLHGEPLFDWRTIPVEQEVDLASAVQGARVVACSDEFFSAPQNLLMPDSAINMGDGWETRRRRGPGHDWVIIKLGIAGTISRVDLSTAFFKGNFPESFSLEICESNTAAVENARWAELLPRTQLHADAQHSFDVAGSSTASHVRLNIFPDGGVSRLRVWGQPAHSARAQAGLRLLEVLPYPHALSELKNCCGSQKWSEQMLQARPFDSLEQLQQAADRIWLSIAREDWLEAFRHHPPIGAKLGAKKAAAAQSAQAQHWSAQEQAQAARASSVALDQLEQKNREYESRFGYIFLIDAAGKSGEQILESMNSRLTNAPDAELKIAAEQQRLIMQRRLRKLLGL